MHAKWVSYFEQFNFVIRYKVGVDNKVPDTLSWRVLLLVSLQSETIGFKYLKELYKDDEDFFWNLGEVFIMTACTRFSYVRWISS